MRNANYGEISGPTGHLSALRPFNGSTMSAHGDVDAAYGYRVMSYGTEIARVIRHPETGSFVKLCTEAGTYSTTTSKHQNYARAWLPGELIDVAAPERGRSIETPAELRREVRS